MVTAVVYGALGLAACGGGSSSADTSSPADSTEAEKLTTVDLRQPPPRPIPTESGAQAAKRPEPAVEPPAGEPPKELVVEDLIEGSGKPAGKGDELLVHHTSIRINGEFFESIWDDPFDFELGGNDVNPGWEKGLPGMRVGGRRVLIVPPALTSRFGVPPGTTSEATLVYVVDLLGVR